MGVEEELFLVDVAEGQPRSVAGRILRSVVAEPAPTDGGLTGSLHHEIQQQQLETNTPPRASMTELAADIRTWRDRAIGAARRHGARVLASGTYPMPVTPAVVHTDRYDRIVEQYGITAREQLTCGCHVHVAVESDEEGVGVLDRIRVWLPVLLALSANSPFWQGTDTRYASFRAQALVRWPTAGPSDVFGSVASYRGLIAAMLDTGTILDQGMLYFDARLSHRYPTVEIRAMDVCLDGGDTVLIAALCRGLVETAARQWAAGEAAPPVPTPLLRLATWQAARHGLAGDLVDPFTGRLRPARDVITGMVDQLRPALWDLGDAALVDQRLKQVLARGNGATRQRSVLARTGQLTDVIADVARVTTSGEAP